MYRKRVEDISLSEEQKSEIIALIENVDDRTKSRITYSVSNGDINTKNFDKAIEKIKEMPKGGK